MSEADADKELKVAEESARLVSKGLATGKVGTFSGAVLGISSVAPGYTLTASIGLIVAAVGLKMPAILIAGFIPMFLTAYAYRELNSRRTRLRRVIHLVHQGIRAVCRAGCAGGAW